MPLISVDEIISEGHVRFWLQFGAEVGAAPTNEMLYAGSDTQYMRIGEVANPVRGSITAINVPDPNRLKRYRRVGSTEEAPEPPTFPVTFLQKHGAIPRQLYNLGDCPATFYKVVGNCKDLSDFEKGWTDYVLIHSNALATERTLAGVGAFDSDDALEDEVTFTADAIYPVGKLNYDIELDEASYASVTTIDAAYGSPSTCASCREGTEHLYVVGTNGTSHNVYYTLDGGATWNVLALVTSADVTPTGIAVAGNYLVVTFQDSSAAAGGYYLSVIDPATGIPGTATTVTTGFPTTDGPSDLYVLSPRRVFFTGATGTIYKSVNLANGVTVAESGSTVNAFSRIDGVRQSGGGSVMVAGTVAGEIFFSQDGGDTWSQTGDDVGNNVTGIAVLSDRRIWVATDAPDLQFTADLGQTWTTYSLPAPYGAILAFNDIRFATDEVGYITTQVDKVGDAFVVYATINGGFSWSVGESRFASDVVLGAVGNRIAVPESDNIAVNANNAAIPGGADGLYLFSAGVR